ncbi:uncharacterized protein (DUF1810 family) [Pelomonas saccharophila]|uniref:Uncharacterized protein (DUF1810 family) n=1 Tax=Roseateles saccharophilus TaxID=304 RepID=A0ABU1YHU5_ROSSA|nr:DUF1810 domain-containing protein [Roseateles saccharophilus]MDR7268434.1 uncharacterized protein (DUF1810 family) [Roseateles saccharophilus]
MDSLDRFIHAQEGHYEQALAELKAGRKTSHWIWFVLPQLRGLGRSAMAHEYGIAGRAEAEAYLAHPLLGGRLRECVQAMLAHSGESAAAILGDIDAMKFRSCLTLFDAVSTEPLFGQALDAFYAGQRDAATLALL